MTLAALVAAPEPGVPAAQPERSSARHRTGLGSAESLALVLANSRTDRIASGHPSGCKHSRDCRSPPDPEAAGVNSPNACGETRAGRESVDDVFPARRHTRGPPRSRSRTCSGTNWGLSERSGAGGLSDRDKRRRRAAGALSRVLLAAASRGVGGAPPAVEITPAWECDEGGLPGPAAVAA
jgi:hypothetical protein